MSRSNVLGVFLAFALAASSVGCGMLSRPVTEREQTAGIGALAGGVTGAIIGSVAGSAVAGGLFGMPLGAVAGFYIGDQMARQSDVREARLQDRDAELGRLREENERLRSREPRASTRETTPSETGSAAIAKQPQPASQSQNAKNVLFNSAGAGLNSAAKQTLQPVVVMLKENSVHRVALDGYTDSVGADAYNQKLSQRRSDTVKTYLVQNGVSAEKIYARGLGPSNPVASNETEDGRRQNRRVEIIILNGDAMASK